MLNTSVNNNNGGILDGNWVAKNGTSSVDSSGTKKYIKDKRINYGNNVDVSKRIGASSTDSN